MSISYYDYRELRAAAESGKPDDINALGEWFDLYGSQYWNGEYYDADGMNIYPVYNEVDEDEFDFIGYTTSSSYEDRFIKEAAHA